MSEQGNKGALPGTYFYSSYYFHHYTDSEPSNSLPPKLHNVHVLNKHVENPDHDYVDRVILIIYMYIYVCYFYGFTEKFSAAPAFLLILRTLLDNYFIHH